MAHATRMKSTRNADGTLKTFDQLMRQTLTVLQYGKLLAQQKAVARG